MMVETIGFVLKQIEYKESDCILTVLTKEHGKISLLARGIRKISSKNSYACLPYTLSKYQIDFQENKTMHILTTATVINGFRAIKEDLDRMAIGAVWTELIEEISRHSEEDSSILFELTSSMFSYLEKEKDLHLVLALGIAQVLHLLGIAPMVDECVVCGNTSVNTISIEDGGFVCSQCAQQLHVPAFEIVFLKQFRLINKANFSHFSLLTSYGPFTLELIDILMRFLNEYSGISIKSYEFMKSIQKS